LAERGADGDQWRLVAERGGALPRQRKHKAL
jgi:hypothetical protein